MVLGKYMVLRKCVMKRLFPVLLCLFVFVSCDKPQEISITNNSSYEVKFSQKVQSNIVYTVSSGKTAYIPAIDTAWPDLIIQNNKPVKPTYNNEFNISLVDLPSYILKVYNSTDNNIVFSVNNLGSFNDITVLPNTEIKVTIYTDSPVITTEYSNYSLQYLKLTFF